MAASAFRLVGGRGATTTRRARRSPCTAASGRRGSTTRRCTSAARSSRKRLLGGTGDAADRVADELFAQARRGGGRRGRHARLDPRPVALPAPRAPPVPDRQVRAAARAGGGGRDGARRRGARGRAGRRGRGSRRCTTAGCSRASAAATLTLREARGLGLPWSAELVERGRRVGRRHASRPRASRSSTGVGMNLGGGTHHAGRDFARGYCLFNDVAVALARLRARGPRASARWSSTATSTRATAPPTCSAATRDAFTLSLHGARNYPFQRIPSDLDVDLASGHRRRRATSRRSTRRSTTRCRARGADARVLPRRRRPVGGRPARPARAHQGRPARPRRARARPPARRRRRASASCSPAATPTTCATRSTSTPRPRRPSRAPPTLMAAPGGVVVMGARRFCIPEVGVRFPPPPSVTPATRSPAPGARAAPTSRARRAPSCARPDRGG